VNSEDYHFYIAHGLCGSCGKRPLVPGSKASCAQCLLARRKAMRRITGYKSWTPGSAGAYPAEVRVEAEKR